VKKGMNILNVEEMAQELGVGEPRVRELARSRHVGFKKGRDWLFTRSDIEKLRPGRVGRPPIYPRSPVIEHIVELERQGIIADVSECSVVVRPRGNHEVLRKVKSAEGRTLYIVRVKPHSKNERG